MHPSINPFCLLRCWETMQYRKKKLIQPAPNSFILTYYTYKVCIYIITVSRPFLFRFSRHRTLSRNSRDTLFMTFNGTSLRYFYNIILWKLRWSDKKKSEIDIEYDQTARTQAIYDFTLLFRHRSCFPVPHENSHAFIHLSLPEITRGCRNVKFEFEFNATMGAGFVLSRNSFFCLFFNLIFVDVSMDAAMASTADTLSRICEMLFVLDD